MNPSVQGILEAALYVDDLDISVEFYQRVFGFETIFRDERACAMGVSGHQVFLLFERGASRRPGVTPGGVVPPSEGSGELHVAFSISDSALEAWRAWLGKHRVEIESTVRWKRGGTSLYFRDPDRHLIELVTPGAWSIY